MLALLFISQLFCATDSIFSKYIYAGAAVVVPKQETWQLKDAFLADGDLYNIQISPKNFKASYAGGDTIRPPYYISEMELLSDKSMVKYVLRFNQVNHSTPKK